MSQSTPSGKTSQLSVRIVADPGLVSAQVSKVLDRGDLPEDCSFNLDTQLLLMDPNRSLIAPDVPSGRSSADLELLVTELPRFNGATVLRSELYPNQGVAVISYPTLGVLGAREGLAQEVTRVIQEYRDYLAFSQGEGEQSTREEKSKIKTMLGMISTNQPSRSIGALSGALAAGIGVGAFGIFYSSIWEMADYLTVTRLAVVNIVAVLAMILWLLLDNSLWDKPSAKSFKGFIALYNGSTLLTLTVAVLGMYVILFLFIFAGAGAIIAPAYMTKVLGEPVTVGTYARISWLAASMGVTAGALGSSFNSDAAVRRLTHGVRERQRLYSRNEDYDGEADGTEEKDWDVQWGQRSQEASRQHWHEMKRQGEQAEQHREAA